MPDGSPENEISPTDEDRDRYLRLLDNARDRGLLDLDEHAYRVLAVGAATSLDELNSIVWELPPTMVRPGRPSQPDPSVPGASVPGASVLPGRTVLPERSGQPDVSVLADLGPEGMRRLDPVDVAMLQMRGTAKVPNPSRRWAALVAVALVFLVLIILGLVLAANSRASNGGNSGNNGLTKPLPAHAAHAPLISIR